MSRAYQRNAADPRQIDFAARKAHRVEAEFAAALAAVLETVEGRRVIDTWLTRAGLSEGGYLDSGSALYFREGRRAYGLRLQADVLAVSPEAFERMKRERVARDRATDREVAAVQQDTEPEPEDVHAD